MTENNKYRVAVLFTGQTRTYKQCLPPLVDFFSRRKTSVGNLEVSVDYFMHSWDVNLWVPHSRDKSLMHEIPFVKANIDTEYIESTLENLKGLHIDEYSVDKYHNIWGGLLYSHFKANELKSRYEEDNCFTYDLVIKTRPDIVFEPGVRFDFNPRFIENRFVYTPNPISRIQYEFSGVNVDDCFCFGDSASMDILSRLYFYAGALLAHPPASQQHKNTVYYPENVSGGGTLMGRVSKLLNITPATYHHRYNYSIVRKPVIENNWNYYKDYEKIVYNSQNYYIDEV